MGHTQRIAAVAAILFLFLSTLAAPAAAAGDRVRVVVVYESMPGEAERARTAALGARIACEFDNLPIRVLSVDANTIDAIGLGDGVTRVTHDSSDGSHCRTAKLASLR